MTLTRHTGGQESAAGTIALRPTAGGQGGRPRQMRASSRLTLAGEPVWEHQLILTGSLDHRTVVELEDEIECLCEEGVSILTLDLRRLDAIDSVGARAVACGGATCRRRGRDFAVLPGSPVVRRALVEVGAQALLAGDPGEQSALAAAAPQGAPRDTSTVMIKNL